MKKIELCMGGLMVGLIIGLVQIAVTSSSDSSYDPWLDLNEDGINDVNDLYILASIYGTSGTPINKTELLLELQARLDSLNASLLTDYYNITDSDDRFVNVPGDMMTGALYVPIVFDKDNSVYYVDPAGGTSALLAGNVGIGIASPSANTRLHVTGDLIGVRGEGGTSGGYFRDTDGPSYAWLGYDIYGVSSYGETYGVYGSGGTYGVYGSGGIGGVYGSGDSYGGYFRNTYGTSHAYLGYDIFLGDSYGVKAEGTYGVYGLGSRMGGCFYDTDATSTTYLAYSDYGIYAMAPRNYFSGNVSIGTTDPAYELDVDGYVQAFGYYTGDIVFQEDGEKLWRMFEEEDGLYLESLKTGKVYSFVLQEVGSESLVESANAYLKPSGLHIDATTGLTGLVIAFGLVFGLTRYRAKTSKEELDAQQTTLSQWQ